MTTQTYKEVVSQYPEWGRMIQAPFSLVIQPLGTLSLTRWPEVQTSDGRVLWRSPIMYEGPRAEDAARAAGEPIRRKFIINRAIHF